ncbi:tripartite tricarboxylate transporter TctB family protein [Chromohalobacter marismortui]|uniref:Tripartite tricarboxylate transporter TctB family protein n=1 Tax=Chromohalobacter marismortui TaxID=42055 RepID=A0A4R7NVY5_9GAMM|nr:MULTISPECIES: tripartite tricarboxylate transporter TctB family protein [Chromohalobacter]MCI0511183.1 tripartite tricarboxylate transporter TctB family protein [Chromohalobacter sp.]MCI0593581.1 tripartite tricarboxylate transporter TctB family protein [Chromohalobacter sp.]TDU25208.1 tripartite tricarboxylate transporter TctB family protein [Chromohalobacter marismortui]
MKDFLLGLAFIVAGAIVYVVAQGFPTMPSLQYGPSLFPSLIGGGFMIGGLVLTIGHVGALKGIAHGLTWRPAPEHIRNMLLSLLPALAIVFYILTSEWLGTTVCLASIMFVLMLIRRTSPILAFGVSIVAALVINQVFSHYLLIPLPEGLLSVWG